MQHDSFLIYLQWLTSYIPGRRKHSDKLLQFHRKEIIETAKYFQSVFPIEPRTVYRGVLLDPRFVHTHDLWRYDHVSFTDTLEVAEAFADLDSIYGAYIKTRHPHYQGYIITYTINPDTDFIWFDHKWKIAMPTTIEQLITYWNQQEIIIGKKEKL